MPYIKQAMRKTLDRPKQWIEGPGELNYVITRAIQTYLPPDMSYQVINDVIGALECAKQEFYRRVVVPYEQEKIEENGDVYDNA